MYYVYNICAYTKLEVHSIVCCAINHCRRCYRLRHRRPARACPCTRSPFCPAATCAQTLRDMYMHDLLCLCVCVRLCLRTSYSIDIEHEMFNSFSLLRCTAALSGRSSSSSSNWRRRAESRHTGARKTVATAVVHAVIACQDSTNSHKHRQRHMHSSTGAVALGMH